MIKYFFTLVLTHSHIWLNLLSDDSHSGYKQNFLRKTLVQGSYFFVGISFLFFILFFTTFNQMFIEVASGFFLISILSSRWTNPQEK